MINNSLLKGKGLFVYSDPGGAKGILAKALELKSELTDYILISDREYAFSNDFDLDVIQAKSVEIESLFLSFKPDFLYLGTSYKSDLELTFLKLAKKYEVLSIAFVDHWTNFRSRFIRGNFKEIPDLIGVIDSAAIDLAMEDGFLRDELYIEGHPYHRFLLSWKPNESYLEFCALCKIPPNKKIIVYAPDPLSNVGGVEKYGCDELTGLHFLLDSLNDTMERNQYIILIKPHPNQDCAIFYDFISNMEPSPFIVKLLNFDIPLNTIIFYSSIVISFFSIILIEVNLLHRKAISLYLSNLFVALPSNENLHVIRNKLELTLRLNEI